MIGKRYILAKALSCCGVDKFSRRSNCGLIIIFNYHRISPVEGNIETLFDDDVFGPTPEIFRQQLKYLQKHTTILSESGLISAMRGELPTKGIYSMVTFDDAYLDNYEIAMPILKEIGVPAVFFVPTSFIEERSLGWWDQIAYIIKNSPKQEIEYQDTCLSLSDGKSEAIRYFQQIMKLTPSCQTSNLIEELTEIAESPPPSREKMDRELMSWAQLREAKAQGIDIGSHTCRHLVLATLSGEEQFNELSQSKVFIESKIGEEAHSLAYPVGGALHINKTTIELVERCGYDLAFSFNTGTEHLDCLNCFNVPRMGAPNDLGSFKATLNFPRLMDYSSH